MVGTININIALVHMHTFIQPFTAISRPRSDAISFHSRTDATGLNSNPHLQDTRQTFSNVTQRSTLNRSSPSPDLPSPTQPLIPTKVSKLVQDSQDYVDVVNSKTPEVSSDSLSSSKRIPLVQVQQPTLIREDSEDAPVCTDDQCGTSPDSKKSSPRSLRRQAALPSESDSLPGATSRFSPTDKHECDASQYARPFSPSQSLPLSSVPFMDFARERSSSDVQRVDAMSMLSTDSGRGTKSCLTGNFSQQDLETLSQSSDLYDYEIDDAFSSTHLLEKKDSLSDDCMDVEKSLSASTLRMYRQRPSLLQQKLQVQCTWEYIFIHSVFMYILCCLLLGNQHLKGSYLLL